MASERSGRGNAFDLAVALLLAVLFGALYGLTFQERMLGDGAGLATMYARGESFAHHVLYLPACRLVALVTPGPDALDPIAPTRMLSVVAAGLGCGFTWLLTRALGAPRPGALGATLLLGLSPGLWFFGTAVEVHALHFLAVAVAAWGVLVAPWERAGLALALSCVLFALAFLAHQLALLLAPGWLLLVQHARARRAEAFAPRTLLLVVAPSLVASVLVALAVSNLARTGSLLPSAGHELGFVATFERPWNVGWMWSDWVLPLLVLIPAATWTVLKAKAPAPRALLALVLVPIAFLLWWGVPEHGGYALGHAPFVAALAAFAFPSDVRRAALVAAPLAAAQAFAAYATLAEFDTGWKVEERVAEVRELLGEEGLFVSSVDNAPAIDVYLPRITEVSLWTAVAQAHEDGLDPDAFVAWYLPQAEEMLVEHGRAVVELAFEGQEDRPIVARRLPYYEALLGALDERFATARHEHPSWPMLLVLPK